MQTSVVIPVHNGEKVLPFCLEGLKNQTIPPDEIIIVDDASIDGTKKVVETYGKILKNIVYIRCEKAVGTAAARNKGVEKAKSEIILFTDDDAIPDKHWIANIIPYFKDVSVSGVSGKTVCDTLCIFPWKFTPLFPKNVACNMAYRKSVIFDLGGLDEKYYVLGSDIDLAFRVLKAGYKIIDADTAIVHHPPKTYSFKELTHKAKRYRYNNLFFKKYPTYQDSFGGIFRPRFFGFSYCGLCTVGIGAIIFTLLFLQGLNGFIMLFLMFCILAVLFLFKGFHYCVITNPHKETISFFMKMKTFLTVIYFLPLIMANRLIGIIQYKKFLF